MCNNKHINMWKELQYKYGDAENHKQPKEPWTCPHPNCPVRPDKWPVEECSLNKPIWIYIPAGQHIHLPCPIHGEHILNGTNHRLEVQM